MTYDSDLVFTKLATSERFSSDERRRITKSLNVNGIAVIENYLSRAEALGMAERNEETFVEGYNAGFSNYAKISPIIMPHGVEFHHPFFVSSDAVSVVTNPGMLDIVEEYLGGKARIHSSLFQKTKATGEKPIVDWHVDVGSNKFLNGNKVKFAEKRLRSILYLSDVKSGGLGYVYDSQDAARLFCELPDGSTFPLDQVPKDADQRIEVRGEAGTFILFDTKGLHRPSPIFEERTVMNVWFCSEGFSGNIPPVLLQPANIPDSQKDRSYIFSTAKNFRGRVEPVKRKSLFRKIASKFI